MGAFKPGTRASSEEATMIVVSSNGEVPIPAHVLRRHGWEPGTELEIVEDGYDLVLRRKPEAERTESMSVEAFLALVPRVEGEYPSDDEIAELVAREASERFDDETRR